MMNKYWMYRTRTYKFLYSSKTDNRTTIVTDKKMFNFEDNTELQVFLAQCLECDNPNVEIVPATQATDADADIMAKLKGTLVDNIERISKDRNFAYQANSISKQIKTLIELKKLELEVKRGMKNKLD